MKSNKDNILRLQSIDSSLLVKLRIFRMGIFLKKSIEESEYLVNNYIIRRRFQLDKGHNIQIFWG